MPVHQGQQCQHDKGNNTSTTVQTRQVDRGSNTGAMMVTMPMWHESKEVSKIRTTTPEQQGQQHPCNLGDGASAMRVTTPLWQWQRSLCINNSNDTIVSTAMTPAWRWQQHHQGKGNNNIATMAKMPGLQRRLHINDGNTFAMRVMTQLDDSKDACASMMAMIPLLQRPTTPARWLH
jgi:hypothetical protein